MADNVTLNSGSGGDSIAADEISSVKYQRIKLIHGADGVNAGDVSTANPLPTVDSTGNTSLASIDGKITAVNTGAVVVSSSALPSGAATAAKQPALGTAGTPSADVISIQGVASGTVVPISDGSGSLTVDAPVGTPVFVRLSDGSAAISTLPVSVASVPSHAVTNAGTFAVQVDGTALTRLTDIETNTDAVAVVGNGAAATSQRVTLANDSTGVLATLTTLTGGGVAHDGVDSGNPHKIGGKAIASQSGLTLVAAADRTDAAFGIDGFILNRPHTNLENIVTGNASNTDGTSTQCIAAQASGIKTYLTSIILTNTSSSMIYVEIKDGSTAKLTIPVPATGGAVFNPPVPIPGTAATAWNFDPSAATTTVYCSMVGFSSKV